MRASLTKALVNFQKSGQGDDHAEDNEGDEREDGQEAPVCGSNFRDFCNGDELLEYFEFMLRKADLVDAATCNMPKEAQFDSSSKRRTADQPKPRTKKHKSGKDMDAFMAAIRTLPEQEDLHLHHGGVQKEKAQADPGATTVGSDHARMIVTGWGSSRVRGAAPRDFFARRRRRKIWANSLQCMKMHQISPIWSLVTADLGGEY